LACENGHLPSHIFIACFVALHSRHDIRFTLEGVFSRFYCERAQSTSGRTNGAIMKRADK
jgi:hypothetical protein